MFSMDFKKLVTGYVKGLWAYYIRIIQNSLLTNQE